MNIVRTSPHYMATQYYCSALQKCQNDLCQEVIKSILILEDSVKLFQSIEDLKYVEKEATKGIQMAPTFKGVLSCCQLKMASSIMLECATELDGVYCFLPLHCLPSRKKDNIKGIIEAGLSTILHQAQKRSYLHKKFFITQKRQDQIDPYLACFYNCYSLASNFTQPYMSEGSFQQSFVKFQVNPKFIPEGENDHAQV